MNKQKISKKIKTPLCGYDLLFSVIFVTLITLFVISAHSGMGVPDEAFYVTIPHRLFQGDRLILDDWHVSQFSSFMQYVPMKLFYAFTGSFDGIILYLRYLYIAFQGLTLLVMYPFFRRYKYPGVIALCIFGAYVPVMLFSLSYYTFCLWPGAVVCTVVILSKKQLNPPVLIIMGMLTAIAVLAEPFIAFCYFLYTVIVFFRYFASKKHAGILCECEYFVNLRYWAFITVGIFAVAVVFLVFLFRGSDPLSTLKAIPYLFNGYEYNFSLSEGNILSKDDIVKAIELYGKVPAVGIAAVTVAAFFFRKKKSFRPFLCVAMLVLLAVVYLKLCSSLNYEYYLRFYGLPLYLSGPAAYLLVEKKDKRLWIFWCAGALMSVFLDISSAVILGVFGALSAVASLIFIFDMAGECIEQLHGNKDGRVLKKVPAVCGAAASVLLASAFVVGDIGFAALRLNTNVIESYMACYRSISREDCDTPIDKGPYKGIYTTRDIARKYDAILEDLDVFRGTDEPVLIYALFPYCYLYVDGMYGTYSAWYVDVMENDRTLYYYDVYPERLPKYIYIPAYDPYSYKSRLFLREELEWVEDNFNGESEKVSAGYIFRVDSLKSASNG